MAAIGHRKSLSVSIERLSPVHRQSLLILSHRNRSSTIIWHHVAMLRGEARSKIDRGSERPEAARLSGTDMPDDYHPPMPRRNPEDIDLGAIKTDLEFLIERVSRLPTRQEQALKPLYTMIGSAAIVIAWIELFWRHCL
jgi:hypothetical protein